MDMWGVVFTHPIGCSRLLSAVIDLTATKWNLESRHVWGFVERRQTTALSVLSCRFARKPAHSWTFFEFVMSSTWKSLHCHQLEEELDDWCHRIYFQNGIDLSCCSPDSWCRRFNVVNASLKSERSLIGPVFSRNIKRDPPMLAVSKVLCFRHMLGEIFLAQAHPSWYRPLHLDHVRVEMHENQDRSQNDGGSLHNASWCTSFSNYGQCDSLLVL